jgi:hypothetical protein
MMRSPNERVHVFSISKRSTKMSDSYKLPLMLPVSRIFMSRISVHFGTLDRPDFKEGEGGRI